MGYNINEAQRNLRGPTGKVTGADRTYVGLVDSYETTGTDASPGTEAGTITYLADIFTIVRARLGIARVTIELALEG